MEACVTAPTSLEKLWLTEAVRLREEQAGMLDDQEANRQARVAGGDLDQRIVNRASWLAAHNGLAAALQHWKHGAHLALVVLAVCCLVSGAGLGFTALGNGNSPVNVFWALGSLLGLNFLLLAGWLGGLLFAGGRGASLGRMWLWLSEKLARDAQAVHLAPALVLLLQRRRLNRWALGMLVHGLWSLALLSALLITLLLLATRRYGFVWETTILDAETFIHLTRLLGALPQLLGFNVPDIAMIRASGDGALGIDTARQAWAAWLIGVLVVWGIGPRLLLAGFCAWRWKAGRAKLTLDLRLPGYSQLRERLMPTSERLGISDEAPAELAASIDTAAGGPQHGALLVAIELDAQTPWPPTLPSGVRDAGLLDSRESRQRLLEQLTRFPSARLAVACDPRRSPDRGTLTLISELSRCSAETRVWLLPPPAGEPLDGLRLNAWHEALNTLRLSTSDNPLAWLELGHD